VTEARGDDDRETVGVGAGFRAAEGAIPREVELKYLVRDVDALRSWLAASWGGALDDAIASDVTVVEVQDRYIDTAYGALEKAGFGARLRREDGGPATITVKSAAGDRHTDGVSNKALSDRVEVEGPAGAQLDPDSWPPSAAKELVEELRGGARLRSLFTLDQRREKTKLEVDGAPLEVTLDRVGVVRGGRPLSTFSALEVEAKSDDSRMLARLASLVEATGFVTAEPRSKEDIARGYVAAAASDRGRRLPTVPKSPGINADDSLGTAGRKVLRMHLARMLKFEEGTRSGDDTEDLHKMRVATRRMRAAWRVFDGAYRPKVVRRYVGDLRTYARALGEVRDLDVLLDDLDAYLDPLPGAGREALEPLRRTWRDEREQARSRLIARLDSRKYRRFVDDYMAFTESSGAGEVSSRLGRPSLVRDTAGSRILASYERVRAYESVMSWADVPTLHELRIDAKRLRYTLEYFSEVLPTSARGLIEAITTMQDELGLMNDAHGASMMTRAWLDDHGPGLPVASREAAALYLDARESDMSRAIRTFRPAWRRVSGRAFRKSLGTTITAIE
jgi:triphosphatase